MKNNMICIKITDEELKTIEKACELSRRSKSSLFAKGGLDLAGVIINENK